MARKTKSRRKKSRKAKGKAKSRKRRIKKKRPKKKPFGGYNIAFEGCTETLEQVFGKKPVTPSEMTKILWRYIKKWKLGGYN